MTSAQVWQTPGDGEQLVDTMLGGTVRTALQQMAALRHSHRHRDLDRRSAGPGNGSGDPGCCTARRANPRWPRPAGRLENAAARPGLSLLATEDPYIGSDEIRRRAADRAGARTEVLDGLGHWWMVQDPARGAAALTRFWANARLAALTAGPAWFFLQRLCRNGA